MAQENKIDQVFLKKLTEILEENYTNEQFGVQELADVVAMSRSQLHRKLNNLYGKSTSQFIREFRLEKALEMLQADISTASEISYKVGFNSPTYFNSSFHQYYGYPPGEAKYKSIEKTTKSDFEEIHSQSKGSYSNQSNKNLNKEKMTVFSTFIVLVIIALAYYFYTGSADNINASNTIIPEKSIAVLPFKNLSGDSANQYFADGVMNNILNHLSSVKDLKVISRTTMEKYGNTNKTVPEIAKEVGVSYLLETSAQKYGDSIKIITQLVDTKTDNQIWSKNFKREYKNIFSLESEIAKQIAQHLKASLSLSEIEQIEKTPTNNLEAYNLYLKGMFFFSQGNLKKDNYKKSIQYFEESIKLDPEFALAYAALAEVYLYLADFVEVDLIKINNLILKSIVLDNNIAEAHSTLGILACWYEWDWDKAEKEYQLAIKINPNSSSAYFNYCNFLFYVKGDTKNARKMVNIAKSLDPLSYSTIMRSAEYFLFEGNYKNAMSESHKATELIGNSQWSYWVNFECYFRQGKNEKALNELIESWKTDSISTKNIKPLKAAYDRSGIDGIYQWIIDYDLEKGKTLIDQNGIGYINFQLYWIAQKYAFLDKKEKAIKTLEEAYDKRSTMLYHIKYDPYFKNLRSEPKFLAILKKMNLGGYNEEELIKP